MSTAQKLSYLNEATWLQLGTIAESMNEPDRAMMAYESALRHNAFSIPVLTQIAALCRAREQYPKAMEYFQRILNIDRTNGEIWGALGHCCLMTDDLQSAYHAYQQALNNLPNPQEPKLWYGIGILYDRYGSYDHAEEAFTAVMRMEPKFDKGNEIYFRLGIIYKQQAKYNLSLECFRYILSCPPKPLTEMDIWFQIGHVHEQQREYQLAREAYERVLQENPNHAKVLQQLGWLYHQNSSFQNQELAISFLTRSLEADQNDAQTYYLLGRCYMAQQKYAKAYESYQQAVLRDGKNPIFWCSIGVLYYQLNQYRDALDAYSRALYLNPQISEVWYDLGTLYESCNNQIPDAIDAYTKALELDPTNQQIKQRLQMLKNQQNGGPAQASGPMPNPPTLQEPSTANVDRSMYVNAAPQYLNSPRPAMKMEPSHLPPGPPLDLGGHHHPHHPPPPNQLASSFPPRPQETLSAPPPKGISSPSLEFEKLGPRNTPSFAPMPGISGSYAPRNEKMPEKVEIIPSGPASGGQPERMVERPERMELSAVEIEQRPLPGIGSAVRKEMRSYMEEPAQQPGPPPPQLHPVQPQPPVHVAAPQHTPHTPSNSNEHGERPTISGSNFGDQPSPPLPPSQQPQQQLPPPQPISHSLPPVEETKNQFVEHGQVPSKPQSIGESALPLPSPIQHDPPRVTISDSTASQNIGREGENTAEFPAMDINADKDSKKASPITTSVPVPVPEPVAEMLAPAPVVAEMKTDPSSLVDANKVDEDSNLDLDLDLSGTRDGSVSATRPAPSPMPEEPGTKDLPPVGFREKTPLDRSMAMAEDPPSRSQENSSSNHGMQDSSQSMSTATWPTTSSSAPPVASSGPAIVPASQARVDDDYDEDVEMVEASGYARPPISEQQQLNTQVHQLQPVPSTPLLPTEEEEEVEEEEESGGVVLPKGMSADIVFGSSTGSAAQHPSSPPAPLSNTKEEGEV
ncbi:hypothetical protein HDU76_006366 [Blyttiomyces sp. JEL0837]|nr:hypothetical protein HDU76_006366 [Blyttiomyces sp. JEL0837]